VVINYVTSAPGAEKIAQQAREDHGVRAITVQADVSNDQDVAKLFTETKKQLGRIDIVMVRTLSPF
jgi:NAD(P)-dependent dehydrogenase (short-subunit alcohol dehydrogenase family)